MKLQNQILTFFLALSFSSCTKNQINLQWETVHQETGFDFYSLKWEGDSLLAFANGAESGGVYIFPDFNNNSSGNFFTAKFNVFDGLKLGNTFYIGSDSANFYSTTDFQNFKRVYIDSSNWVNYLMQQPLYRLIGVEEGKSFFAAGGGNNGYGVTFYCEPGNNEWVSLEYNYGVRSAFFQQQNQTMWVVGNGLVGNTKTTELRTTVKQKEVDNKYFTDIAFADSVHGVVVGHNGAIYTTNNGGESWQKANNTSKNGFGKRFLNRVRWFQYLNKWVVAGNNGVLFWSDKSADIWHYYKGFDGEHLLDIEVSASGELLIAATGGNIFKVLLP